MARKLKSLGFEEKVKRIRQKPDRLVLGVKNTLDAWFGKRYAWREDPRLGLKQKQYQSYDEYLTHQKSKLKTLGDDWLSWYDKTYFLALRKRLLKDSVIKKGSTVICLAARIGTEVRAFQDMGCFAVGIDINPGKNNKYVVYGDFHSLQFPDQIADIIFTNSLDHALDLNKVISETRRVLKPHGLFILEIQPGEYDKRDNHPGNYEVTYWRKVETVIGMFTDYGFKVIRRLDYKIPWFGDHFVMRLSKKK